MLIFPYSTALTLARPPYVCYAAAAICALVYTLQINTPITETLLYYPDSWNPVKMVTAAFAHANFWHLLGNLVFFMAFAPALEILVGNALRFVGLILFVAFVTAISYSLTIFFGGVQALPTLGFSGVVMGMIGLAAYLMPQARVRVFFWLILFYAQMAMDTGKTGVARNLLSDAARRYGSLVDSRQFEHLLQQASRTA